eukprot:1750282-Prymnesium_polylepis.2
MAADATSYASLVASNVAEMELFMRRATILPLPTLRTLTEELAHGESQEVIVERWEPRVAAAEAQQALTERANRCWINRGYLRDTQADRPAPVPNMRAKFLSPQFPANILPQFDHVSPTPDRNPIHNTQPVR